ncbi:hypothetical protein SI859A1_03433 [Aurantimonas manganoxydans SI85-9A1]|uniref:Uncharacterized protein n=1 Tax=Aurantimonas manganoxydans (strain ATCC BAA-1229 / DSM 21871 / SI85-9A1) TaxID=287752 RepID=Q1YEU9_AURMS|nr:hypothetical protein SI859A1_03433 [Aurantimonas manganoxydans SI85-9A1]
MPLCGGPYNNLGSPCGDMHRWFHSTPPAASLTQISAYAFRPLRQVHGSKIGCRSVSLDQGSRHAHRGSAAFIGRRRQPKPATKGRRPVGVIVSTYRRACSRWWGVSVCSFTSASVETRYSPQCSQWIALWSGFSGSSNVASPSQIGHFIRFLLDCQTPAMIRDDGLPDEGLRGDCGTGVQTRPAAPIVMADGRASDRRFAAGRSDNGL